MDEPSVNSKISIFAWAITITYVVMTSYLIASDGSYIEAPLMVIGVAVVCSPLSMVFLFACSRLKAGTHVPKMIWFLGMLPALVTFILLPLFFVLCVLTFPGVGAG